MKFERGNTLASRGEAVGKSSAVEGETSVL
jgi:hypothetical protein